MAGAIDDKYQLVGSSQVMRDLREKVLRVAAHGSARVLISGPSGSGKECVARMLHNRSPRFPMPFVTFNCATVAKELLEDRLWGHVKGAFTGAFKDADGLFAAAEGGTLFLDEIGEMDLTLQGLLLRVLETDCYQKIGSSVDVSCDVRLVCATNRSLPRMVKEGKFRKDLYERLNVVPIRTPELKMHKSDIPEVAAAWFARKKYEKTLSVEQVAALMRYDYPGNVRELLALLERAATLDVSNYDALIEEQKMLNAEESLEGAAAEVDVPENLNEMIAWHVRRVIDRCGGNVSKAATRLGVVRNTVRKYLCAENEHKDGQRSAT